MKSTTLFLLFILFTSGLNAQKKPFTIEEFYKIKSVGSPVLSNSGERIAYSVTEYDLPAAKTTSTVYVMNKNGSSLKSISDKLPGAYSPFWSVSDDLYLLSKGQLYKYSFDKDNVEQLTDFYPAFQPRLFLMMNDMLHLLRIFFLNAALKMTAIKN